MCLANGLKFDEIGGDRVNVPQGYLGGKRYVLFGLVSRTERERKKGLCF